MAEEYHLNLYEQETIICFNNAEPNAEIYTYATSWKNKLAKMSAEDKGVQKVKEDKYSQTYILPKKYIKVIAPRVLTEEERKRRADLLKKTMGVKDETKNNG